ncbi:hypothetical protein [Helicobacter pylori]|uniref:hypothetical protein n=1 Tax=Helicobacter pylori TaxID=210 RepID=UPI00346540E1
MEKNDRYEIVTNVIESLENGGSFNQRDREKFAQTARTLGIEDSVIKEMIDIYQTLCPTNTASTKSSIKRSSSKAIKSSSFSPIPK